MLDFCRTEAAATAAGGQENRLFGTEREQRAELKANSEPEYRYRERSRASEGFTEGGTRTIRPKYRMGKKHETELVRTTQTWSTVGTENG